MRPSLWIAYDFTDIPTCISTLDTIVAAHPATPIIHEIGRPTLLAATLAGVPIVAEFRQRLAHGQELVADFKGYDVPYSAEGYFYYRAGVDIITVMSTAPDPAITEAVEGARADGKKVAFDLMSHRDDQAKTERALDLVGLGADLLSCHTGWNEQATGQRPHQLIDQVCSALPVDSDTQVVAMGGITPADVRRLGRYCTNGRLYAIVAGRSITGSANPVAEIDAFLHEIEELPESEPNKTAV